MLADFQKFVCHFSKPIDVKLILSTYVQKYLNISMHITDLEMIIKASSYFIIYFETVFSFH